MAGATRPVILTQAVLNQDVHPLVTAGKAGSAYTQTMWGLTASPGSRDRRQVAPSGDWLRREASTLPNLHLLRAHVKLGMVPGGCLCPCFDVLMVEISIVEAEITRTL